MRVVVSFGKSLCKKKKRHIHTHKKTMSGVDLPFCFASAPQKLKLSSLPGISCILRVSPTVHSIFLGLLRLGMPGFDTAVFSHGWFRGHFSVGCGNLGTFSPPRIFGNIFTTIFLSRPDRKQQLPKRYVSSSESWYCSFRAFISEQGYFHK